MWAEYIAEGESKPAGGHVETDYVQAHKGYNLVRANGDEDGDEAMDKLEEKMTPEQISETQRLANEWIDRHK